MISPRNRFDHPRDVSIVRVVPSQLHLSFDTRLTREVEVHPRVTGKFASGEQIVQVDADPPAYTITGPRHHVEKIDAAITDPIDATGTLGSAVFTTNVYVTDPLVQVDAGHIDPRDRHGTENRDAPRRTENGLASRVSISR